MRENGLVVLVKGLVVLVGLKLVMSTAVAQSQGTDVKGLLILVVLTLATRMAGVQYDSPRDAAGPARSPL